MKYSEISDDIKERVKREWIIKRQRELLDKGESVKILSNIWFFKTHELDSDKTLSEYQIKKILKELNVYSIPKFK